MQTSRAVFKIVIAVLVFICVFAITWLVYFPHSPLGKQEANLKLAEAHRPIVEQRLKQLIGASSVSVGSFTGLGGSLSVSGNVSNGATAEAVIKEVLATHPPVTVQFELIVGETNAVRKVVDVNSKVSVGTNR